MAGTSAGGKLAAQTNRKLYGKDFYKVQGAKGGRNGHTGGFGAGEAGREQARRAGAIGGSRSRRPKGSPNKAIIVKDEETELTAAELKELFGTQEPELTHPKLFNIRRFF